MRIGFIFVLIFSNALFISGCSKLGGGYVVPAQSLSGASSNSFIALVNEVASGDNSGTLASSYSAPPMIHTSGNLVVVICTEGTDLVNPMKSVTDTAGNAYTALPSTANLDLGVMQIFYSKNIVGSPSNVVSCNFPQSDAYGRISVYQFSGASPTDPFDVQVSDSSANHSRTQSTVASAPPLSPARIGGVIVSAVGIDNTGVTFSAGAGFTLLNPSVVGSYGDQYERVVSLGPVTPAMAWGTAYHWTLVAASFK